MSEYGEKFNRCLHAPIIWLDCTVLIDTSVLTINDYFKLC